MTQLTRITVYPFKSLDGVALPSSNVLASGALQHDRRFALAAPDGAYVNGKRTAAIHQVRAEFDLAAETMMLAAPDESPADFSLSDGASIAAWFTRVLQQPCGVIENPTHGLPDDPAAPGPTLISTQSLQAVADWFEFDLEECRRRLRANLEIDAPHAFWEDHLVGRDFRLGGVTLHATGVCQRCVVPTRDSRTGEAGRGFQKRFAKLREECLPSTSPRSAFHHYYRLALNTRLVGSAGTLAVGDSLSAEPAKAG